MDLEKLQYNHKVDKSEGSYIIWVGTELMRYGSWTGTVRDSTEED